MVVLVALLPRKPGMSKQDFHRHWRETHGPLVVETLGWAKECGASELSLNFCALADFLSPERAVTLPRRAMRRGLLAADSVFQLERLHSFSRKFHPDWRPRYLCVERLTDLPLVGLAYLRVEQLLAPPARWRRRIPVSHLD